MELNTHCYLGNVGFDQFQKIVYWCLEKLGPYGNGWRLDWDKHTVYLNEKNAVMFLLRWS